MMCGVISSTVHCCVWSFARYFGENAKDSLFVSLNLRSVRMRACFLVVEVVAGLREEYFKPEKTSFKKVIFHSIMEIFSSLKVHWKKIDLIVVIYFRKKTKH